MAEKFPFLFAPRRFFLGLVEVKQWLYDWGYSKAYIELMCVDTTIYKSSKSNEPKKATKADAEEAIKRFKEKHKTDNGFVNINLSQLKEE